MLHWFRRHAQTRPLRFGTVLSAGRKPAASTLAKTSEVCGKGSSAQGGFLHTSFYLHRVTSGLERELNGNPLKIRSLREPGVTATRHCTTWLISATANLGQQCDTRSLFFMLTHRPGGAPDNRHPSSSFSRPCKPSPLVARVPTNCGGTCLSLEPREGPRFLLHVCNQTTYHMLCQQTLPNGLPQPFTVPPPRWAEVFTRRLYLLSLLTETPLRHLLSWPLVLGGPGQMHTGRVGQT